MSETKQPVVDAAVVKVPAPASVKMDLSDLPALERARLQKLRAEVMIQRGLREHAKWLETNGGLSKRQSAGDAAIAMEVGSNLGFPLGVARTAVTVINGNPAVYGDSALALIRSAGLVDPKKGGYIRWSFRGTENEDGTVGDDYEAVVASKRADTGEELECTFSVKEAKRAGLWGGEVWAKWGKKRMLRYRALGFLVRDLYSDIVKGVHLREELVGGEGDGTPTPDATPPLSPEQSAAIDPLWSPPESASAQPAGSPEEPGQTTPAPAPSAGSEGPAAPAEAGSKSLSDGALLEPLEGSGNPLPVKDLPASPTSPSDGPDAGGTTDGAQSGARSRQRPSPAADGGGSPTALVLTPPPDPVLERDASGKPLVVRKGGGGTSVERRFAEEAGSKKAPPPPAGASAVERVRAALAAAQARAKPVPKDTF